MSARKLFPRVDIDRGNNGVAASSSDNATSTETRRVVFPKANNATAARSFDFAQWYGNGIDPVVRACQAQAERFLTTNEGDLSIATVVNYCQQGLNTFLTYLTLVRSTANRDLHPGDIDRNTLDGFLAFLDDGERSIPYQLSGFKGAKTFLIALCRREVIPWKQTGDDATFPINPFPRRAKHNKGARPLARAQRRAFTAAVKTAVMPLFAEISEATSELLAYALLVIALHTGRNTTPLLELTTDCLRAHPKEHLLFLVVYKRRGHSRSTTPVRVPRQEIESSVTVLPTVVRLIRRVIELTAQLRDSAPAHLRNHLWLYRPTKGVGRGGVSSLSSERLSEAGRLLAERFDLKDTDGKLLRVSVSMLRKTFVNRVNDILEDDLLATAAAAGNTVAVVGTSYLTPGEASRRNWKFMGQALTNELLSNSLGKTDKTPVGRCSDASFGQFAPKQAGAYCMSFLDCLRCRNYVVTGDDLYRLFSFYWRVYEERSRIPQHRWQTRYAHIVRLIDRDVVAAGLEKRLFKPAQVEDARARARADPHPFWSGIEMLERLV